jgi:7-cyano-7-deazaguanine reductase
VPGGAEEGVGAAAVFLRERRAGEVDARHGDYDTAMDTEFVALGHAGSEHYAGLETFPNPGVTQVDMTSDELSAMCPITGQPDLYNAKIEYKPAALCLESKSLKIYLGTYRNEGAFCEALAVKIRDDVAAALELPPDKVRVTLIQKARGGITITATT